MIVDDIKKVIEGLSFLIDVYDGVDDNDEQQLQHSFIQFKQFMDKNEYFENIRQYNKETNDKLLALAIDNLTIIHDTQQKEGIDMEDKKNFHILTYMGLIISKTLLYTFLRMNKAYWIKDSDVMTIENKQ